VRTTPSPSSKTATASIPRTPDRNLPRWAPDQRPRLRPGRSPEEYIAYSSPGVLQERRLTTYNLNGQQLKQENYDKNNALTATIKYNYADPTMPRESEEIHGPEPLRDLYLQTYTYDYLKASSYQQQAINGNFAVYYSNGTTYSQGKTQYYYDANGNQIKITDSQDATKNRDLLVTTQGQILQQLQNGKKQYYYYAQASRSAVSATSRAPTSTTTTPRRHQLPGADPLKLRRQPGRHPAEYRARVFGDAGLWYLIADANGIKASSELRVGQTLTIPNQITNVHNSSSTFRPITERADRRCHADPANAGPAAAAGCGKGGGGAAFWR